MVKFKIEDISYTVTEYCPGRCRYCSIWELKDNREKELTSSELDSIFSSENLDLKKVHITGGEPHLTDTYYKAVCSLYKFHKNVVIDTPVTGWYPEEHEKAAKYVLKYIPIYRVDVSLDGDEFTNGKIRLHKDAYQKSLDTINRLNRIKGVVVRIQFTIYKENYHLIEWVYNLAKKLNVGLYIGYGRYNPERYRNKKDNLTKETLSKDSFVWDKEELLEIDRQLVSIGYDKSRYASKYYLQKAFFENKKVDFNCFMGQRSIDITPYGDVYPCLLWLNYLHMGNVRNEGSLDNVLDSIKAANIIRDIQNKKCHSDCLYTCANKMEVINPKIPAVGMINYGGGKFGYIFSDKDVIQVDPWWLEEYKNKNII